MGAMRNKFKITMALKSVFFSIVILLIYSYKREVEIEIVYTIVAAVSVASIFLYFKNINKYVLTEKVKRLYQLDIKSSDFESAKALIHRGRFSIALTKLKSVSVDNPDNENIKLMISEIEQYLKVYEKY